MVIRPSILTGAHKVKIMFRLAFFCTLLLVSFPAYSEAYVPTSDDTVLYENTNWMPSFKKFFKTEGNQKTKSTEEIIVKAHNYLYLAKTEHDPRYYGLVEALLQPIWESDNPKVQLIKAEILQFNHQFSASNKILNVILDKNPDHVQARLLRANNYYVLGEYERVLEDCNALPIVKHQIIKDACELSVNGLRQEPTEIKKKIRNLYGLLARNDSMGLEEKVWVLGVLTNLSVLHRDEKLAEFLLDQGLSLDPSDSYLLSIFSDLLHRQGNYQSIVNLLSPHKNQLDLLVRLVMAEKTLKPHQLSTNHRVLAQRIQEDDMRGEASHLREKAMYEYFVNQNYKLALQLALKNWENQKELVDARLLYLSAKRNQSYEILEILDTWFAKK